MGVPPSTAGVVAGKAALAATWQPARAALQRLAACASVDRWNTLRAGGALSCGVAGRQLAQAGADVGMRCGTPLPGGRGSGPTATPTFVPSIITDGSPFRPVRGARLRCGIPVRVKSERQLGLTAALAGDSTTATRASRTVAAVGLINSLDLMSKKAPTSMPDFNAVVRVGGRPWPSRGIRNHLSRPIHLARASRESFELEQHEGAAVAQQRQYDAVLVDAYGTLIHTVVPVIRAYAQFAAKHGVEVTEDEVKTGFRKAFSAPWSDQLRYEGDGKKFWRFAVATATGCSDEQLFEDLYSYFARGESWHVEEGAVKHLTRLRAQGVKLAVVSNFDTRLRPILRSLAVDGLFDAVIVSAEVGSEKPSPKIFRAALDQLGVRDASRVVHVGDDERNDIDGARGAGLDAWLWKTDVQSFDEIAQNVLGRKP